MSNSDTKISQTINQLEWLIQIDPGQRGIHQVPGENLCTWCQGNLARAVQYLAQNPGGQVGIVTGFFIPTANPPAPENDGPPGALFVAQGLNQLGYKVCLLADHFCFTPLEQGFELFSRQLKNVELVQFPFENKVAGLFVVNYLLKQNQPRCLISIERVGPCHTLNSFLEQSPGPHTKDIEAFEKNGPGELAGECLTLGAIPISQYVAPIHLLFEKRNHPPNSIFTIGIGDGGNEIGMGSIPWRVKAF